MRLDLTENERAALEAAVENYLDGVGMEAEDEDEQTLERIRSRLAWD